MEQREPAIETISPEAVVVATRRSRERWQTWIDIHPFSETHDVAELRTSVDDITQHLAILYELAEGPRRGHGRTAAEKAKDRAYALAAQKTLRPEAEAIARRLPSDLQRFFHAYLAWHSLRDMAPEEALKALERFPAELALGVLGHPAMQDHIATLRQRARTNKPLQRRLRSAFRRLALSPGRRGRPKGRVVLPARDREKAAQTCRHIYDDVREFRNGWLGVEDSDALTAARRLIKKHAPAVSEKDIGPIARALISRGPGLNPKRITHDILWMCFPSLKPQLTHSVVKDFLKPRTK